MKKLKTWQIVLLVIFYPIGIIYLIVRLCRKKNTAPAPAKTQVTAPVPQNFNSSTAAVKSDFYTKVVGVTFKNNDGSDRQEIICSCRSGENLVLVPCPSKEYPEAIGVFTKSGKQLGHLKADLAHDIKVRYSNNPMSCTISDIHGGEDGKSLGVNLHIVIYG